MNNFFPDKNDIGSRVACITGFIAGALAIGVIVADLIVEILK